MRLAIISDIHSNLQALKAVMKEIEEAEVDQIACAGDIIGYGANPNECCQIVSDTVEHAVVGNHEHAVIKNGRDRMNTEAAIASEWTADVLAPSNREFLRSLRHEARFNASSKRIAMFHGSPGRMPGCVWDYVYERPTWGGVEISEELVKSADCDLLILGHTHEPYVKKFGRRMAVNPGSVGQPRDGIPEASFAVMDTGSWSCDIRRIAYDIRGASEAILAARLPERLAARLSVGE